MSQDDKSRHILRALARLVKESALSINELRVVLALERVVARIDAHKGLRDKLVFKGGFVLLKSFGSQRFTRDLDALAHDIPKQRLLKHVTESLAMDLNDGLYFGEVAVEDLIDQGQYGGYRIKIPFQIGPLPKEPRKLKKLSRVHVDVGFGDVILGKPKLSKMGSIIEGEGPLSWRIYPLESIFAEKLETLVSRGSGNSRAKDLFDLVILFDEVRERRALKGAIKKTFSNRATDMPTSFAEFFARLDLTILERSWGSVELTGVKMSFATCQRRLRGVLRGIDKLLVPKRRS